MLSAVITPVTDHDRAKPANEFAQRAHSARSGEHLVCLAVAVSSVRREAGANGPALVAAARAPPEQRVERCDEIIRSGDDRGAHAGGKPGCVSEAAGVPVSHDHVAVWDRDAECVEVQDVVRLPPTVGVAVSRCEQ